MWRWAASTARSRTTLRFARESDWYDVFVTWLPAKWVSATLAYVDLGSIATRKHQEGVYASFQLGF